MKRRTARELEGDGQDVPGVLRRQSAYTSVCLVDPSHAKHRAQDAIHQSPHLRHLFSLPPYTPPYMFEVMMKPMSMGSKLPVWSVGAWMLEWVITILMCLELWIEALLQMEIDAMPVVTTMATTAR